MSDDRRNGLNGEVERQLDVYAHARLSPSVGATTRMRTRIMAEAHRRAQAAVAPPPDGVPRQPAVVVPLRPHRSLLAAAVATSLLIVAFAAAAFAARPGGPLYDARLALEEALLPADSGARAAADLRRLNARLAEALEAAASGDQAAIAASLDAYREVIDSTVAMLGGSDDRDALLEDALEGHLVVLNELLDKVPEQARPAIERAIERSDRAVDRIQDDDGPGPNEPPATGPPNEPPGQSGRPDRTPPGQSSERPTRP